MRPKPINPAQRGSRAAFLLGVAALLAATAWCFMGVVRFDGPVMDDPHNLILNPHVGSLSARSLRWALGFHPDYVRRYMPLAWLWMDLVLPVTGLDSGRLHAFGLLLHLLNTGILAFVLRRFLHQAGLSDSAGVGWAAVAGAAFYGLHPLRVELLGWASTALIWQPAFLMALAWAWLRTSSRRFPAWEGLAYLASVLTYPVFLGLGPAVLAADAHIHGIRQSLRRNWPLLLASAAGGAVVLLAAGGGPAAAPFSGPLARAVQFAAVEGHFIWKLAFPVALSPFQKPVEELRRCDPGEVAGVIIFVGAWLACMARRMRPLFPWVASFTLLAAPFTWVTDWENPDIGDRYALAISALAAAGIALLLARASSRPRPQAGIMLAAAAAVLGAYAAACARQVPYWKNDRVLFTHLEEALDPADPRRDAYYAVMQSRIADFDYSHGDYDRAAAENGTIAHLLPEEYRRTAAKIEASRLRALPQGNLPSPIVWEHMSVALEASARGDAGVASLHLAEARRLDPRFYGTLEEQR